MRLTNALYATMHHMPVSEQLDIEEKELVSAFQRSSELLDQIISKAGDNLQHVMKLGHTVHTLGQTVKDETQQLAKTRQLLLAFATLRKWEASLRIHAIQASGSGRG
jgi:uncharacterized membrane-anchored protein YhcB (DUF1043 family)